MNIAYLENSIIDIKDKRVYIIGTVRVEFYHKIRPVLFMHEFRQFESKAVEKILEIFGYSAEEGLPDIEKAPYLLKLTFDDAGYISDAEAITEEQAKQIRMDILKAMPSPEPPPAAK